MKIKRILTVALVAVLAFFVFVAKNVSAADEKILIWVGGESAAFYDLVLNGGTAADGTVYEGYAAEYAKNHDGAQFPYSFNVVGVDLSAAAATFLQDTEKGAEIFSVPHDNLGKLLDGSGKIAPVKSEALINQMKAQNSDAFLEACFLQAGDGSEAQFYAVPYISQALFLVYNKELFAGKEDKLDSWEGILEVAKANNALATAFMGDDGFNFSSFLLAQPESDDAKAAFKKGTLQIYKNGNKNKCYNWGDDQVAIHKYAQRFITDPNGRNGTIVSNDGFGVELKSKAAVTAVIGAWKVGEIESALGSNYGAIKLPSFTLTEADAYGTAKAGMKFRSGTFADCKAMVKKKDSKYASYLDEIMMFLSSDPIQELSFTKASNLPASSTAKLNATGVQLEIAQAQLDSAQTGIAQPFGVSALFNQYYYSSGAPAKYALVVTNNGGLYGTDAHIKRALIEACYIWTHGQDAPDNDDNPKKPSLNTWLTQLGYEKDIDAEYKSNSGEGESGGEQPSGKKGCGSAVSTGNVVLLGIVLVLTTGLVLYKVSARKREE